MDIYKETLKIINKMCGLHIDTPPLRTFATFCNNSKHDATCNSVMQHADISLPGALAACQNDVTDLYVRQHNIYYL